MQGSFSDEALSTYVQVLKDTLGVSFSEGSYDFVRCVKPNGDAYGTAGQCRKGVQEDKGSEESGSTSKGEGGGYLSGSRVDLSQLEGKAEQWRKEAGLKPPGDLLLKHDRVHVLLHEYLGGKDTIASLVGVKGKSPTVAEEYLVTMLHRDATARSENGGKPESKSDIKKHFVMFHTMLKSFGQIPDDEASVYRDYDKFTDIYENMRKRSDFNKLIEAVQTVTTPPK